jgi:hypothetical protein
MASKTKLRASLKRLMRQILPSEKHISILIDLTGPLNKSAEYDRMAAVVGSTFLEYGLRKTIKQHFKSDSDDPEYNYLFLQDDAPYRDFASLNRLARALGILSSSEYDQLETIRHIRNVFAHAMDYELTFESDGIRENVDSLAIAGDIGFDLLTELFSVTKEIASPFSGRRRIFVHSVFSYYWKFLAYHRASGLALDFTSIIAE